MNRLLKRAMLVVIVMSSLYVPSMLWPRNKHQQTATLPA